MFAELSKSCQLPWLNTTLHCLHVSLYMLTDPQTTGQLINAWSYFLIKLLGRWLSFTLVEKFHYLLALHRYQTSPFLIFLFACFSEIIWPNFNVETKNIFSPPSSQFVVFVFLQTIPLLGQWLFGLLGILIALLDGSYYMMPLNIRQVSQISFWEGDYGVFCLLVCFWGSSWPCDHLCANVGILVILMLLGVLREMSIVSSKVVSS